jgi:acrylyl-CoA reductase (NADPH)
MMEIRTILIDKKAGEYASRVTSICDGELPSGEVTVAVQFSGLNYKDALAITGQSPVVRLFPMVPGIDFAGVVKESRCADIREGDFVLLNGWGFGEAQWGGLSEQNRCDGRLLTPLPPALSLRQSMALGTAGHTAMLCVMAIQKHGVRPEHGPVAVTGAAGGVGSVAIMILARLGYEVVAITGRTEEAPYLEMLGASQVISREQFSTPARPLGKERWAAAIDSAGSHVLANICATTRYGGVVAACGLAAGMDLHTTVAPFILRGISLIGVDSVMCPTPLRNEAWQRLAQEIDPLLLDRVTERIVGLQGAIEAAPEVLAGKVRGRIVVDVNQ